MKDQNHCHLTSFSAEKNSCSFLPYQLLSSPSQIASCLSAQTSMVRQQLAVSSDLQTSLICTNKISTYFSFLLYLPPPSLVAVLLRFPTFHFKSPISCCSPPKPTSSQQYFYRFMVSEVTTCCILISVDVDLGTAVEQEYAVFVFLDPGYLTQCIIFQVYLFTYIFHYFVLLHSVLAGCYSAVYKHSIFNILSSVQGLLSLCYTSKMSYYILKLILSCIEKCSCNPLSKEHFFAAGRNNHRKPPFYTIQRSMNCREPSLNEYICISVPVSMAQGPSRKRDQEDYKNQNTRQSALKQSLLETVA